MDTLRLLWTQWGPHLLSSYTDPESALRSLAIIALLCCPFIAHSAPWPALWPPVTWYNSSPSLSPSGSLSFFLFIRLSHAIPDSSLPLLLCRSVSLFSSLPADADCLCNALECPGWLFSANYFVLCCFRAQTNWTGEAGCGLNCLGENNDGGC